MATTITRISALAAMALALLASRSSAQDAYPTHPVRVIAASAAGGNPDVLARILSARLSEIFNNPFVVEDVPGVGGVIAAKQTAAARPDGYTLGLNDSGSLGISIAMNPDANYTLQDFTPITALARLPTILVIRPDVPANTLAEFVALAKAKPGAMSFGSAGTGSIHQMTMIIFEKAAGISLLHVPYRGGTGLVNALLTGEVDAGWSGIPNVVSLIKTGKLRALCISVCNATNRCPRCQPATSLATRASMSRRCLDCNPRPVCRRRSSPSSSPRWQKSFASPRSPSGLKTLGIHLAENGTAAYAKFMQDDLDRYTEIVNEFHLQIKP